MVNDFVVAFLPIGHLVFTASPIADAGLYLIVTRDTRQIPLKRAKLGFDPYHRECQGDSFDWDRCESLKQDNPISIPILEPNCIDSLLDDRVLIRVLRSPAEVGVLFANET
jgi:hypothetical protein